MAYGGQKVKPVTKFGEWLNSQMQVHNLGVNDVAKKLHFIKVTVIHHRTGKVRPTFVDVVAYCWLFGCNNPETVWEMIDILIDEEE